MGAMQHDLTDAVKWAVDSGIADPDNVCIYGGSYGGYACLQVNYRGSSGYGKSFLHKGDKEWGVGAMQHDLTDAVKWAVDQKIADPANVCIYGGSYGGYACLAGLTFTPDLYKCGVDIVGARPASFLNWRSRGFGTCEASPSAPAQGRRTSRRYWIRSRRTGAL